MDDTFKKLSPNTLAGFNPATRSQCCQIFLDATYQNRKKYTKRPQNIVNGRKNTK
jgi:hypothetical protein